MEKPDIPIYPTSYAEGRTARFFTDGADVYRVWCSGKPEHVGTMEDPTFRHLPWENYPR